MSSEMIPVRCVNDIFIAQFWIAAVKFANDVVRFERANLLFDLNVRFGRQRCGPKILHNSRFLERIEILPTIGE